MSLQKIATGMLLLLLLTAGTGQAGGASPTAEYAGPGCPTVEFTVDDPANDPVHDIPALSGLSPSGPVDFVAYRIAFNQTHLTVAATLRDPPPRDDRTETYRYWLGFHVRPVGGEPQYLDVRVGATTTYDTGSLVGSNQMGNPTRLHVLVAHWEGPRIQFHVPLWILDAAFEGRPYEIGRPTASADGPHATGPHYQGPTNTWRDRIDGPEEFAAPPTCPAYMAHPCLDPAVTLEDPPFDPTFRNVRTAPHVDPPGPVDFLGYGMRLNSSTLSLTATLREPPPVRRPARDLPLLAGFRGTPRGRGAPEMEGHHADHGHLRAGDTLSSLRGHFR